MRNTQSMRKELPELFDEFMYEYEFVRKVRPATITKYRQVFTVFHKLQPDCSTQTLYIINDDSVLQGA
jgi:hypothetical protein